MVNILRQLLTASFCPPGDSHTGGGGAPEAPPTVSVCLNVLVESTINVIVAKTRSAHFALKKLSKLQSN